jgi:hypothetical protein
MKNLLLLLVCALTVTLVSCGGDEPCDNDLSGTYVGTNDCGLAGAMDATLTITGEDGDYSISGIFAESDVDQDGCVLSWSNTVLGIGNAYEVTFNGNEVTVVERENATDVVICTFTGTK